jgi:hypothetical protein
MKLNKIFIDAVKTEKVKMAICLDCDENFSTFTRWVAIGSDFLTKSKVLAAIEKHTGLTEAEIFKTEKA